MGIFARLGTLIKSNINELISKAEDPEKMLSQVLLEMQQQLVEAKKQVAMAIADEKRLQKQFDGENEKSKDWERKAMLAVRAGDDALAKEALLRKAEHDDIAGQYQHQWLAQKAAVDKLKDALRLLSNKIDEAKRKKNLLVARKKRAEAQRTIAETMSGLSDASAFETFDRMTAKIDQLEAEAEAGAELAGALSGDDLESKFKQLEAGNHSADAALSDLKAKMGLAAPSKPRGELPAAGQSSLTEEDLKELEDLNLGEGAAQGGSEEDERSFRSGKDD
ncbi:MAG: PspA/IM30 family protein [Deltaproteobacteria bacterium]|nr:PspA/IM30 family protein [Deltaproteobacteria bacterium]